MFTRACHTIIPIMARDLPAVCQIPESSVSAKDCTSVKVRDELVFLDDGNTV